MAKSSILSRVKGAWNVFTGRDPLKDNTYYGMSSSYRPDRVRLSRGNERSIVTSVYNRIAMDASTLDIKHVRLDKDGRYKENIDSGLNECLNVEANIDQTGRSFRQDIFMSLLDEGCVAVVPVDTSDNPDQTGSPEILTMRTAKVIEWYPKHVKIDIYNDNTGKHEQIRVPKTTVAIVENPLYAVVNEPNSIMQRLIRKLNILDRERFDRRRRLPEDDKEG